MQYIVLDLEWNQPITYHSPAYKACQGKLLFEMIQIGAVKLDENRRVIDSFNQLIQPVQYVRLHPRIARITNITQDELCDQPLFEEAVRAFAAWCGGDSVLLTWGCDDASVFRQNMQFFHCDVQLSPVYDIQSYYGKLRENTKERCGLKTAMNEMEIVPNEEEMPFHNAVNDAYYTALVFAKLPDPEKVLEHPVTPRELRHIEEKKKENETVFKAKSVTEALCGAAAQNPACPVCGHRIPVTEGYLPQGENRYMALAQCEIHGLVFVKLHFTKNEEGKRVMIRNVSLSSEQNPAYISTKRLQWQRKLAEAEKQ